LVLLVLVVGAVGFAKGARTTMTDLPIAIDTETELITPGNLAPRIVCLTVAEGEHAEIFHHTEAYPVLRELLESDRVLVGHNVAYDFAVIARAWPDLMRLIFHAYACDRITDTQLREKLQHLGLGVYRGYDTVEGGRKKLTYHLADLVQRRLGIHLEKEDTWRLRYGELRDVPLARWPADAVSYAIDDALSTWAVWQHQESDRTDLLVDQYRQARAAWWLHLMACWGLTTDAPAVNALAQQYQEEYNAIEKTLQGAGLVRADGTRDTKAAKARMLEVCADPPLTPTGQPKLDRDSCEATGDPDLMAYAEISGLKKKLGTDIELLRRGIIQPRFDFLETGRTSSKPNVQNLPRAPGVRECFVPRPGYVYAAADYSGFELRTVAQVCLANGWRSKLAEALNEGFDPHLEIARRILGISYNEAKKRIHEPDVDNARQTGKVANFGFPGGLGIVRFVEFARKQYGVVLTEQEAAALKKYWLEAWPEFVQYFKWVGEQCDAQVPKVKQLYSNRVRANVSFTEACNSYFQGLAADAAKEAGFLISQDCYTNEDSVLFGARPVNFVHDEFIVEVLDDVCASDAAEAIAHLMVKGAEPWLPDLEVVAEPYLMRRWTKKAKPIRDGAGRLIPWE
jgi:hypothetical protein